MRVLCAKVGGKSADSGKRPAVAGHEAENSIERRLMRFAGAGEVFDRLRRAGLDEIGNAKLGDGADRAAEGGAGHDAGEVFGFLLGHDFQPELPRDGITL